MSRRLKILAVIGLVLFVLSRVQVHVPVAGTVPALAVAEFIAFLAVAGFLAVIAIGIIRALRYSSPRLA